METKNINMLDTVETPWDLPIDEETYNKFVNDPSVAVNKHNDQCFLHMVFFFPKGSKQNDVPAGLADKLVRLGYAEIIE